MSTRRIAATLIVAAATAGALVTSVPVAGADNLGAQACNVTAPDVKKLGNNRVTARVKIPSGCASGQWTLVVSRHRVGGWWQTEGKDAPPPGRPTLTVTTACASGTWTYRSGLNGPGHKSVSPHFRITC